MARANVSHAFAVYALILLFLCLANAPDAGAADGFAWTGSVIDENVVLFGACDLRLDGAGQPHVAYVDGSNGRVRYARWTGQAWQVSSVTQSGYATGVVSLALDGDAHPHIAYFDGAEGAVRYSYFTGFGWRTATVDVGHVEGYVSIALEQDGTPHVAYPWSNGNLRHGRLDGLTWVLETVDDDVITARYVSLALDALSRAHIAYYGNGQLLYASWIGYRWDVGVADTVSPAFVNLALDVGGTPHLGYRDSAAKDLWYARWNGTAWVREVVDRGGDVGWDARLTLDPQGSPVLAHYDRDLARLELAWKSGSVWLTQAVDVLYVSGWYGSVDVDANGRPHLAYFSWPESSLKYSVGGFGTGVRTWDPRDVAPNAATLVAEVTSMGPASQVTITFEWRVTGGEWRQASGGAVDRPGFVTARLEGLAPDTSFEVHALASWAGDSMSASDVSFKTPPPPRILPVDPWVVIGGLAIAVGGTGLVAYTRTRRRRRALRPVDLEARDRIA